MTRLVARAAVRGAFLTSIGTAPAGVHIARVSAARAISFDAVRAVPSVVLRGSAVRAVVRVVGPSAADGRFQQ